MKSWLKNKKIRVLFELWIAGFSFFMFTVMLPIHWLGIITIITLSDTFILDRKGLIRNIIINTIIYFSYDFICLFLFESFSITFADPFIFMIYDLALSYLLFNKATKLRVDDFEYL